MKDIGFLIAIGLLCWRQYALERKLNARRT
jgi:hypothetical protein